MDLLSRKEGASLAEIMDATDWQKHSRPGIHQRNHEEDGTRCGEHEERGGRADVPDCPVGLRHRPRAARFAGRRFLFGCGSPGEVCGTPAPILKAWTVRRVVWGRLRCRSTRGMPGHELPSAPVLHPDTREVDRAALISRFGGHDCSNPVNSHPNVFRSRTSAHVALMCTFQKGGLILEPWAEYRDPDKIVGYQAIERGRILCIHCIPEVLLGFGDL